MGVIGYVLKVGAKSLAKKSGTSPYWDAWYTLKQSPNLATKAVKGMHKAYTKVRDAPMPYTKEHAQRQISKLAADDRVPKLDPVVNAKEGVKELAQDHGVANSYLEYLVQHVADKDSIKMIRSYVQSHAADNLTPYERAEIIIKCAERLKYLDIIHQFFGGGV